MLDWQARALNLHHNSIFNSMWKQRFPDRAQPSPHLACSHSAEGGSSWNEIILFEVGGGKGGQRGYEATSESGRGLKMQRTNIAADKGWLWWNWMAQICSYELFIYMFDCPTKRYPSVISIWISQGPEKWLLEVEDIGVCVSSGHVNGRKERRTALLHSHPCP